MKDISIVVPVYNEELIVEREVASMVLAMHEVLPHVSYEIILVENGSEDRTREIVQSLAERYKEVRMISLTSSSYGMAVKTGLCEGRGRYLVLFNIDFWDISFMKEGLVLCRALRYDIVVGSKTMRGAKDFRPWFRRIITRIYNFLLYVVFGFKGTDTHGIKILQRDKIMPILKACHTENELFDTELLLRAQKKGVATIEIPVICYEKRVTVYSILGRIPSTLKDLLVLFFTLR